MASVGIQLDPVGIQLATPVLFRRKHCIRVATCVAAAYQDSARLATPRSVEWVVRKNIAHPFRRRGVANQFRPQSLRFRPLPIFRFRHCLDLKTHAHLAKGTRATAVGEERVSERIAHRPNHSTCDLLSNTRHRRTVLSVASSSFAQLSTRVTRQLSRARTATSIASISNNPDVI